MSDQPGLTKPGAGVNWGRVGLFYGISFGMVALLGAAFALMRVDLAKGTPGVVFQLTVAFLYMPMPFVAGLIVERIAKRRPLLRDTFTDFGRTWWRIGLFSVLTAVAVYLVNLGMVLLLGNILHVPGVGQLVATQQAVISNLEVAMGGPLPPGSLNGMPPVAVLYPLGLIAGVAAGFTVNGLFAFGEEYGWRGVLMDELRPLGPVKANLLTGVMWGFWHAPIVLLGFNYQEDRILGVFMMCVWLIPFSFLLWRSRDYSGSVLTPAIIHGAFNGSAGFYLMLLASGSRVVSAPVGILGAVTLSIVAAASWALTRGRLYEPRVDGIRQSG